MTNHTQGHACDSLPGRARRLKGRALWIGIPLLSLLVGLNFSASAQSESEADPFDKEPVYRNPTNGLGSWIWEEKTYSSQPCRLWRSFVIPPDRKVVDATLRMTVDNEFTLFLNGREIGHGAEWRELFDFDLTPLLKPGLHVLAVRGLNSFSSAGMLLGMRIQLDSGEVMEIRSDENWRLVPEGVRDWESKKEAPDSWPRAHIMARFGEGPYWKTPINVNVMPTLKPVQTYFWQSGWFQISIASACAVILLVCARLMAKLALHRKEQKLLHQERARIAQDIHDDIGARMSQLVLHGEVAQSELPDHTAAREHLDTMCQDARGIMSSMDEILWAVNPQRDTLRDFTSFVCRYAEDFFKPTGIQCRFEVDTAAAHIELELPLRRRLLMAIKEALNNAAKHSEATELQLQIHHRDPKLTVVVADNGKGFDSSVRRPERNGLANLEDRMRQLGGKCSIVSQPGNGCRVELSVPLKHTEPRDWNPMPRDGGRLSFPI